MTLRFICAEIKKPHLQIRREQKEALGFNGPALVLRRQTVAVADAGFCGCACIARDKLGSRAAYRAILHERLRCDSLTQ